MSSQIETWKHGYISTNGVNLHYVTQGKGPLMLMLHGFPEFWYSWRHQIPEFASNYKVVAVDLRGYNDSDRPLERSAYRLSVLVEDIKGVIEGLGYERCILVGHDWGGAISWFFAYAYPEMLERLIVLNLPHPVKFSQGLKTFPQILRSWYILFFQIPLFPEWILSLKNYSMLTTVLTKTAKNPSAFSQEAITVYRKAAAKPGAVTAMLNYYRNTIFSQAVLGDLGVIQTPTLLIWGENDIALSKELTYGTQNYVKHLRICYIPDCGHWVQQEKPELVNQYINEWLNELVV